MTEIKIKISELRELCQLVSLSGKDVKGKQFMPIPEFLINASEGSLKVAGIDKGNHLALEISYKAEVVLPGPIVVGDVEKFLGFLDRFNSSDTISLKTTENKIILTRETPYKKASIPMAHSDTIEGKNAVQFLEKFKKAESGFYETSKTKFEVKLTLDAENVKDVIDDGEAVKQRIYPWKLIETGGPNQLMIKVGSEQSEQSGEIETSVPVKNISFGASSGTINVATAYAYGIDNVFGNLTGEVFVYFVNNIGSCPMIVEKSTEKYSLRIVLAPVTIEE